MKKYRLNLDSLLISLYLNRISSNIGPIIPEAIISNINGILVISKLIPSLKIIIL